MGIVAQGWGGGVRSRDAFKFFVIFNLGSYMTSAKEKEPNKRQNSHHNPKKEMYRDYYGSYKHTSGFLGGVKTNLLD